MKQGKLILTIILINCLLSLIFTSLLHSAGTFDFNNGTTQGWTLDQMYVTATQTKFTPVIGYTLVNSDNQLVALTGSLLIGRSDQNDIYLESPDLSSNSNWQGIGGYSIDVKRLLYTPCWGDFPNVFFVQFQLKVIDMADGNKEKLFAEHDGTNFIFHDIKNFNQLYHFTWKPSWLTDPRYKVKKIRVRITGPGDQMPECWLRGSWNIDNVIAEAGTGSYNTNPGSNVQVNLGGGVNVTFNNVSGAGNTSLTTSSSGTPPPGGLAVLPVSSPLYYSITTTATFTGNITICIQYSDAGLTSQQEAALALYVYEQPPGQWTNITTSINTNTNVICGQVAHLSEFAIMYAPGGTSEQWVLTNQPTSGTITCFTVTGIGIFAGTEAGGVFLSTDNGGSWNPVNTGLTNLTVRALCSNGAYIFAGTWGGGVFRTNNSTTINWTPFNTGLTHSNVSSLYCSGSNLLAGTWGGGVLLSTNNGSSWTPINNGITQTCVRSLYISGTHFFAGTINGLFHSTNSGASWTAMNTGLTNTAAISLAGMPIGSMDKLFAGTDGGGVFLDTPMTNWTAINSGLSHLHIPYLCVHSSNLFAATWGGGVFLNQDPTAAWSAINDGLTNLYIRTLITSGSYIFAGTDNGGIWRRILSDLISDMPDISCNPMSWNYGSVEVGNSSDKTFMIKNEGVADLNVTGSSLTGANAMEFSIQTNATFTLAPGASCDMMIKFAPTGAGSKSATLSINSNDPDENPLLIALTGTGLSTPTCSITVISPNGGESVGCSKTITWTSSNASGNVKIEYYCNDTWHTIVSSTPNDGSYTWTVPNNTVCSSKIKISDVANSGCWDMSDNYFNINCTASCSFTITAPNGGENIGCSTTITWTSTGASGNVKLEYYCGTTWNTIIASTPNDGSYTWTIPAGTVCSSKIKVSDVAASGCWDMSNNYFNINCGAGPCNPPYVKPEEPSIGAGMEFHVPIHIKGNTSPIDAFGFEFKYCADKFHLIEVMKGPLTSAFSFFQYQETSPGNVNIGGFHTTAIPMNADGIIAIVKLYLDICPTGETCVLNITGLVDDLVGMNACSYTFNCPPPCKLGDVNNDGSLTPGDALCAFQIYLNGGTPPAGTACDNECALFAADVNCTPDGITPGDALYIFQGYLGGKTPPLDCKPAALPKEADLSVSITSAEGRHGEDVLFSIELDPTESVQAFGLDLGYPTELLTFVCIRPTGMTDGWDMLDGKVNVDGVVTVGGFATDGINAKTHENPNSVKLVDVIFKVNDNAEGLGDLWLFNLKDDLAGATERSGRFNTSMEGVRRLGGLEVPTTYYLEQNYPNPFNMDTEIMYQLPKAGYVTVTIYNSVGHQIRSLVSEHHEAGRYAARWDGTDDQGNEIPSGVYIYQIKTGKFSDSKKMILIK